MSEHHLDPNAAALVQRLIERTHALILDEHGLDALRDMPCCVLFLAGDSVQYPEALDVAVILPELARELHGAFSIAVARAGSERAIAARFAVRDLPALLFFRAGQYVTALTGVYDWQTYRQYMEEALAKAPAARVRLALPLVFGFASETAAAADAPGCSGERT